MPTYPVSFELLRLESPAHDDMLTDGAICLLAEHGVTGLTVQALATWAGVTRPALNQRLSRGAMQELVARRFADRWVGWTGRYVLEAVTKELVSDSVSCGVEDWHQTWSEGWSHWWPLIGRTLAMLPETEDEVAGLRAWHALEALGVTVPSVAAAVSAAGVAERRMIGVAAPWASDADVALLDAVVRGLRVRMSAPEDRLSARGAQRILLHHLGHLRRMGGATPSEGALS